jgi:hypothetical protein
MKAVLRLILSYFTGTPILLWASTLGLVCGATGWITIFALPPLTAQNGLPSPFTLAQEALIELVPVIGVLCFAFGASLLPALVWRLATSHYLYVLPYGRTKVVASVLATITLIALFASAATLLFYVRVPQVPLSFVFSRSFPVALLTYTFIYVVLWLIARSRGAIGAVLGSVVIIAALMLPLRFINAPSTDTTGVWIACGALWATLAAGFLLAPRLERIAGRVRRTVAARTAGASYRGGAEIDYLVGTAQPWRLALGQVVPIVLAAYFIPGWATSSAAEPFPRPWLLFMTILSVLSAATASLAASRSRALWLRADWTRAQLFARIERAFWRYNAYALGVLMIGVVATGERFTLPTQVIAFGLGLVILGTTLGTYLGLMITATITWLDTVLAVAAMGALLALAYYAADFGTPALRLALYEASLAVAALAFRELARRRWRNLDWMRCRPDTVVRAAT